MTIQEAARQLGNKLQRQYANIQAVGIRHNNVKAYDENPERFAEKITEDSLLVYTTTKPMPAQLKLTDYAGYKVNWKESGRFELNSA